MRDANCHGAAIGGDIINAIEDRDAARQGAEVVIVDQGWFAFPLEAWVLEVAHQFTLLGVDADDRVCLSNKPPAESGDAVELAVAVGVLGAQFLLVDSQGELELAQQSGNGTGADVNIEAS
jgi:hypothetical protein